MNEVERLTVHVEVLEERLARLAAAFKLLLTELDTPLARELGEALAKDFEA